MDDLQQRAVAIIAATLPRDGFEATVAAITALVADAEREVLSEVRHHADQQTRYQIELDGTYRNVILASGIHEAITAVEAVRWQKCTKQCQHGGPLRYHYQGTGMGEWSYTSNLATRPCDLLVADDGALTTVQGYRKHPKGVAPDDGRG